MASEQWRKFFANAGAVPVFWAMVGRRGEEGEEEEWEGTDYLPHSLHVLMPQSEFRASEEVFGIRVDCQCDTLEDIADRIRQEVFVPASHRPLWVSPATGKPHLDCTQIIINQGIKDGDLLKLFYFTPSWPG